MGTICTAPPGCSRDQECKSCVQLSRCARTWTPTARGPRGLGFQAKACPLETLAQLSLPVHKATRPFSVLCVLCAGGGREAAGKLGGRPLRRSRLGLFVVAPLGGAEVGSDPLPARRSMLLRSGLEPARLPEAWRHFQGQPSRTGQGTGFIFPLSPFPAEGMALMGVGRCAYSILVNPHGHPAE